MTNEVTDQGWHFILRDSRIKDMALLRLNTLPPEPVMEVIIRPYEEKRTPGQNSNYWISLREYLRQFNAIVNQFASDSGNNAIDIKREIARQNPPEYAGIIFASNEKVAHDFIKQLSNVPTSTTLKKRKEFPEFTEAMNATMNDLIGQAMALQQQYAMR